MKRVITILALGVTLMSACAPAVTNMEASEVWARTGMEGGNSAVYMMLVKGTGADE